MYSGRGCARCADEFLDEWSTDCNDGDQCQHPPTISSIPEIGRALLDFGGIERVGEESRQWPVEQWHEDELADDSNGKSHQVDDTESHAVGVANRSGSASTAEDDEPHDERHPPAQNCGHHR